MIGLATETTPLRVRRGHPPRADACAAPTPTATPTTTRRSRWLLDGRAGLGELEPVQPLDAGPDAFAELAAGPSERLKVFLA